MIVGLHHVALVVTDLDEGIAFYSEHLGFELVDTFEWDRDNAVIDAAIGLPGSSARGAMMKTSNAFVELWQYRVPESEDRRGDLRGRAVLHEPVRWRRHLDRCLGLLLRRIVSGKSQEPPGILRRRSTSAARPEPICSEHRDLEPQIGQEPGQL